MFNIEQSMEFALAAAHKRISAAFKKEFEEYGVTPPQFTLLAILWKRDGLSQVELSQKTEIDRTTLVGIIDRLEKSELIKRQSFPGDRRAYRIFLTDKGKGLEEKLCQAACRVQDRISQRIISGEYYLLKRLLNKLGN